MKRIGLAVLLAAALTFTFWPPVRLAVFAMAGRGNGCPVNRAIAAPRELAEQIRQKDRLLAASKLIETDPAGYKLYETPLGRYWIPQGSEFVLPYNLAEMERAIYFDGEHTIRAGDTVLDCGANIGVFTRRALDQGASRVVAIEPGPENVECLRRNFATEIGNGRVIVVPKGVWDKDDVLELKIDPENSAANSFVIQRPGANLATVKVPLTTIDKLVTELGIGRVQFIKMDIEGAEPNAIDGAKDTLLRDRPRLSISAYHASDHPVLIPARVQNANAAYQVDCGPCAEIPYAVRPDVLYFH
jgi:FkbM family methyltransferase